MKKRLSFTVGITTCYGDPSMLDTVRSIRASKGIGKFRFIIVADRVPISAEIKKELKKYDVELIENKAAGSQRKKHRQIIAKTNTDLLVFMQDDVLIDDSALSSVVSYFQKYPRATFVSARNTPLPALTLFESAISVGTHITNSIARRWNNGDNYLSVIGRFMAFPTVWIKKFQIPDRVATSDAYHYFENKRRKGVYKYLPNIPVYFRNPQNMTEHLRKSSRFQYSKLEMSRYFRNIQKYYKVPPFIILRALIPELIAEPIRFLLFVGIFFYTRLTKLAPQKVLNPIWETDISTKKIHNSL